MTGDPTTDPNFSGVTQPAFDALVRGHVGAAPQLERLAGELWTQLTKLGEDTGPALRIRAVANLVRMQATELQRRQPLVHELEKGHATFCSTHGTIWEMDEPHAGRGRRAPVNYFDVPPFWAPTDFRRYNTESPTAKDAETLEKMRVLVLGAFFREWPTASYLLGHWLGNSGEPVRVNPEELLKKSPQMQAFITEWLDQHKTSAYFDTGWHSARFSEQESLDLYYALNGYQMRVHGRSFVKNGTVYQTYTIDFYKRYNFGVQGEGRKPFHAPLVGNIPQQNISHLHAAGKAQDFDVFGSVTLTRPLPDVDPRSVYWPGG